MYGSNVEAHRFYTTLLTKQITHCFVYCSYVYWLKEARLRQANQTSMQRITRELL